MQKRVGLARAIAADPEIIFFDEPTTGLDPIMADVINNLIIGNREGRRRHDTVDHPTDLVSARKIADRIAMLYKGKIIWGRVRPRRSTTAAIPMSISSSTARAEGPIKMEVRR